MKVLTSNLLYNGIKLNQISDGIDIYDWLKVHYIKVFNNGGVEFLDRVREGSVSGLVELLKSFDPDVLVLNEVMPDLSAEVFEALNSLGYNYSIGREPNLKPPMSEAALIATKFQHETIDFILPDKSAGGSVGVRGNYKGQDLHILAPHPSAFNFIRRKRQLNFTRRFAQEIMLNHKESELMIIGDLNESGKNLDKIFHGLDMERIGLPSFPSEVFMKSLARKRWFIIKLILGVLRQPRDIDHVFYTNGFELLEAETHDVGADHLALKAHFKSLF